MEYLTHKVIGYYHGNVYVFDFIGKRMVFRELEKGCEHVAQILMKKLEKIIRSGIKIRNLCDEDKEYLKFRYKEVIGEHKDAQWSDSESGSDEFIEGDSSDDYYEEHRRKIKRDFPPDLDDQCKLYRSDESPKKIVIPYFLLDDFISFIKSELVKDLTSPDGLEKIVRYINHYKHRKVRHPEDEKGWGGDRSDICYTEHVRITKNSVL